ncbi:iron-containing alcohol dehydrogenase family protein [Halomicronema hongdechloris]|nr:iron-containing alcohol dehydrogenase family protein [Halomicronema hongdechloris]
MPSLTLPALAIAPARVIRGAGILATLADELTRLGRRPLLVGGQRSLPKVVPELAPCLEKLAVEQAVYGPDCSETSLARLHEIVASHQADLIVGIGGGKALDTAKLLAHQAHLPIVTIATSAATCAAWTALSNIYSEAGAFLYDVALDRGPDLLVLDYDVIQTAPQRTLIAGIGDALAKWYEASVSSGHSEQSLVIAAVQQARVLRDILFQKTPQALAEWGGTAWCDVVDASVLLAGVVGGLGGAQCRTVAAHAVHNGLTHVAASHGTLHGEKVAYGILVQLRLEEMGPKTSLAATARQQLLQFYDRIGLPQSLDDLGLGQMSLADLRQAATVACRDGSDIYRLPFSVTPDALMAAMVSSTAATPWASKTNASQLDDLSHSPQEEVSP